MWSTFESAVSGHGSFPASQTTSEAIPAGRFWTPEGMDDDATFWHTSGAAGRTAYLKRRATL
jgi:hypothetical protein